MTGGESLKHDRRTHVYSLFGPSTDPGMSRSSATRAVPPRKTKCVFRRLDNVPSASDLEGPYNANFAATRSVYTSLRRRCLDLLFHVALNALLIEDPSVLPRFTIWFSTRTQAFPILSNLRFCLLDVYVRARGSSPPLC